MRKSRKFLLLSSLAFIFLFGIVAVNAATIKSFSQKLNSYLAFAEMSPDTKTNTSSEGYVRMTNMGGASSLGFRARGKQWNGSVWQWLNYGPTTTVTGTGITYSVYYMQSLSSTMPVYLSVRNNTYTSSRPTVSGTWQYDR